MSKNHQNIVVCPRCGEPMKKEKRYLRVYDWDNNPKEIDYFAYRCRNCFDFDVYQNGNKINNPIKNDFLNHYKFNTCRRCGVRQFGKKCYYCGRINGFGAFQDPDNFRGSKDEVFRHYLKIPPEVKNKWNIKVFDILNSTYKADPSQRFSKFAYAPIYKKLIIFKDKIFPCEAEEFNEFGYLGSIQCARNITYREEIEACGDEKYDDYILGQFIDAPKHPKILLQKHKKVDWMWQTHFVLRRMGIPQKVKIVWLPSKIFRLSEQ